ncbi:hypothetical protein BLNAU_3234 [Blattamonas nauphoetae]|uniref:Uncharacterized protein n=1 Tax=Blattamonas nauphoetae TaxID=2049346 RepID=A0ABQ9YDF0_9EUKA|nr:hypothetical protein BLNAU_3234 [Blattamonas nauphoetae]
MDKSDEIKDWNIGLVMRDDSFKSDLIEPRIVRLSFFSFHWTTSLFCIELSCCRTPHPPHPRTTLRRVVVVVGVSESINDMNSGGSLLCHNTSFAQCHPPSRSAPNPDDPDTDSRVSQHFTKNTPIIRNDSTNHVFILCTFTDFPNKTSIYNYRIDINLRIDRCSFQRGTGHREGCVYWYMQDRNPNEFSLTASSFVDQSTDGNGGSVFLWKVNIITIADCTFVNSSAKSIAGAVYVDRGAKNEVHLARCLFHKCRQTGPLGDEIGDFYERWLVGSRMLIGERIEQSDGG